MAHYQLIRAADCIKPGHATGVFLKLRIQGALPHDLRDHGRLVRVSWLLPTLAELHRVLAHRIFCISFYGWPHAYRFMTEDA